MIMTFNHTESLADSFNETRSVFYCPKTPHFIWDLNNTTSLKIILAFTIIACPVTILLNLLVVLAVKTRRELKKNSNILLSSLAVTDLLVGAVSMPLTITLDALVLHRILFEDIICAIDIISDFVLYTACGVSFFHLLLIAWERYVAIAKWMEYRAIVTRHRLKKYAVVAWLFTLLTIPPLTIMEAVVVRHEVILVVDVIMTVFGVVCFFLIAYFHGKAYLGVRKWNRTQMRPALVKAKLETKIAYTTFWLTLSAGISCVPAIAVHFFVRVSPIFRENSIFRWAEIMLQLNSLFNPLLYCYRDRRLRKAALELLRCRKPQRIQPVARTVRRTRRRRYSVASLDVEELQFGPKRPRCVRSESCGAVMCSDTVRRRSIETVKQRPRSAPPKIANDEVFTQQHNKLIVTVQIENAPIARKKRIPRNTDLPKDTTELKLRSRHRMDGLMDGKIVPSLNKNSFVTLTNSHQNAAEKNFSGSRSLPILSTNLNASDNRDNRLTVAEQSV